MKKAFLFPLLLVSFSLAACNNAPAESSSVSSLDPSTPESVSSSASAEEVSKLKDLLSKQDMSPIYDKMFVSQFSELYEAYSDVNGELEDAATQLYTYHGAGLFGCLYEVSEEAYEEAEALGNPDFFDYLARGIGDYAMIQTGSLVSYLFEVEDELAQESLQNLDFAQNVEARFTEETVQVVNSLGTKPVGDGGYNVDEIQSFNGIIDKGTLFDAISVRAFSDIFARTNLFDGQRSCETIDRIYFDTVKELVGKSDAELGIFMAKNDIRIEEEEENTLVHFNVGDEELIALLDEHDIFPGTFEGTLTYEKESGLFTDFEYRIVYVDNEVSGDDVHAVSMNFEAQGYSLNQKIDRELYIDPSPTVYDDAETFLDDVVREVIPPVF